MYGGLEWFNTRGRVVVFLDDTRRIQIVYQDILTEEEYIETIEIYGLPARPPKTTKLSIEVEYHGADKGAIVIRDMGFGNLYPTTNKIYRKEFDISEIKKKHAKKIEHERIKAAEGDTEELIGKDPVDRDAEAERERQERIQAEELAAQDALKHEIHMDLDDLRYRAENDSDNTEDVVYYGTASPEPEGEEVDVDIADTEAEVTDSDMSAPVGETAGIDEQESEREAAGIDEQESEREAAGIDEQESEREAADIDEMKLEDEAADGDEQETERAKEKDEAVESELADEDIPETEPASAYVYNAGDVKEDVGDVAESDEIEDEDIDVYGMKIHDDDDDDDLDSDEDEPEQSRFTIPAYLRGQHFDPGE